MTTMTHFTSNAYPHSPPSEILTAPSPQREQQLSDIPHAWARRAIARVHALQGFCTFCFHNLHRLPFSFLSFLIKIKELSAKKIGDFTWNLRHLWEYLRHFFTSLLSVSKMLLVIGGNSLCFLPSFTTFCHDLLKGCYNKRVTHLFQAI